MDKLILDFEGECVELPSVMVYIRTLEQIGINVEHNGHMYRVVGRDVSGVDEVAAEFVMWDHDSNRKEQLVLTIKLENASR